MIQGGTVRFARRDWKVVGILDAGGAGFDSEIWGDADQFLDAFQRRPVFSSVTLRVKDPGERQALAARFAADPQLSTLSIQPETEYWKAQSEQFSRFVILLGMFVATIFSIGAVLGAMITMYAQVAARTREIGTLRALGFRRRAIVISFLLESVVLALVSGGLGLCIAALVQLASFSMVSYQSGAEVTFRFLLTSKVAAASLLFAGGLGYAGGLLPALRAAFLPISQAVRES